MEMNGVRTVREPITFGMLKRITGVLQMLDGMAKYAAGIDCMEWSRKLELDAEAVRKGCQILSGIYTEQVILKEGREMDEGADTVGVDAAGDPAGGVCQAGAG